MSRHFNYELDERRIKLLLNENKMSFSEDVWNDFLSKTKPIEKTTKLPNFKINFAINKSVFLTGVFIILIGGFTLVIAKFVDFSSTKSNTENLREVKPEPDNYKIEKIATVVPKKEIAKATATLASVQTTMMPAASNTLATLTPSTQLTNAPTYTHTNNGNANNFMARNTPDTAISNAAKKDSSSIAQNKNTNPSYFRKKKKKEVENLETKPLTTGLPTTNPEEQEPELKLD